ncbi:MAG TPA: hypothetical protein VN641_05900 [Urbifossiella sp.]|nr:hypothetical protein [Urbifossiella sp.]
MVRRFLAMLAVLAMASSGFAEQPPAPAPSNQCIVYEIRVVAIPAGAEFDGVPAKEGEVALLTDAQLKAAMTELERERQVDIMQAPKLTAEPGKEAVVRIGEQQFFVDSLHAVKVNGEAVVVGKTSAVELGTTLMLNGRIAADGKHVAADVEYRFKRVRGPVEMIPVTIKNGKGTSITQYLQVPEFETHTIAKKGLALTEGQSAVIGGPQFIRENRSEFSVPVLSGIPVVGRMFRTVGISQTPMRKLLIVSASVIELKD